MTSPTVDSRYRITLPPEARKALDAHPNDRLVITIEDGKVILESRRVLIERMWANAEGNGHVMEDFIAEKRAEAAREATKRSS